MVFSHDTICSLTYMLSYSLSGAVCVWPLFYHLLPGTHCGSGAVLRALQILAHLFLIIPLCMKEHL